MAFAPNPSHSNLDGHEPRAGKQSMVITFWCLFGLVAWCYAGYPLFMLALARVRPNPTHVAPWTPHVSVVMAVRNEQDRIRGRVENLLEQGYPRELIQVVVVCNGCTDATEAILRGLAATEPGIEVIVSPPEGGKAEALNRGIAAATGEVVVFGDARQRFEPNVLERLTAWLADPTVGAVSGRLVIGAADDAAVSGVQRYWQLEVALRQAESETGSVVGATGAIYAIRRASYVPLPPGLILDDVLTPMRIVLSGLRVVFAPDAVAHDEASPDSRTEFRRKVRTTVGNLQLLGAEPRLLSPISNPILARFISHKLLRVLAPLCLLGMLAAGFLAGSPFYLWLVWGQLAFYALGVLGLLFPIPGLGIPAGFLLGLGAVFAALFQSSRGAETLWGSGR